MKKIASFTLIELLVVIAIIAILAALLLPALRRAREMGYQAACISNQRQVYLGIQTYTSDFDDHLPRPKEYCTLNAGTIAASNWSGLAQALVAQYPQYQVSALTNGRAFDYTARLLLGGSITSEMAKIFKCPADPRPDWKPGMDYSNLPIDTAGTPTVTYEPGACWTGYNTSAGNYLTGISGFEPYKQRLIAQRPDNELLLEHQGGAAMLLFGTRNNPAAQWTRPVEFHGGQQRLYPGVSVNPNRATLHLVVNGTFLEDYDPGAQFYHADLAGWSNPYLMLDGHVEVRESLYHTGNLWHQQRRAHPSIYDIPGDKYAGNNNIYGWTDLADDPRKIASALHQ